jgi:hypothetical protein
MFGSRVWGVGYREFLKKQLILLKNNVFASPIPYTLYPAPKQINQHSSNFSFFSAFSKKIMYIMTIVMAEGRNIVFFDCFAKHRKLSLEAIFGALNFDSPAHGGVQGSPPNFARIA